MAEKLEELGELPLYEHEVCLAAGFLDTLSARRHDVYNAPWRTLFVSVQSV